MPFSRTGSVAYSIVRFSLVTKKIRVLSITGKVSIPGGADEMAALVGKEETLRRLRYSLELLNK